MFDSILDAFRRRRRLWFRPCRQFQWPHHRLWCRCDLLRILACITPRIRHNAYWLFMTSEDLIMRGQNVETHLQLILRITDTVQAGAVTGGDEVKNEWITLPRHRYVNGIHHYWITMINWIIDKDLLGDFLAIGIELLRSKGSPFTSWTTICCCNTFFF